MRVPCLLALSASFIFPCAWCQLHVCPHLVPVASFPASYMLSRAWPVPVACLPALSVSCMFSHTWCQLHVFSCLMPIACFSRLVPVACFLALGASCMFASLVSVCMFSPVFLLTLICVKFCFAITSLAWKLVDTQRIT